MTEKINILRLVQNCDGVEENIYFITIQTIAKLSESISFLTFPRPDTVTQPYSFEWRLQKFLYVHALAI